jgi:hypothetical protein
MELLRTVPDFAEAVDDAKKLIESRCRRGGFVAERGRLFALLADGDDVRLESAFPKCGVCVEGLDVVCGDRVKNERVRERTESAVMGRRSVGRDG